MTTRDFKDELSVELPNTLWELLQLALDDMAVVRKDPRYRFDMEDWHWYNEKERVCYVCMAGCVMANTLKIPMDLSIYTSWDLDYLLDSPGVSNSDKVRIIDRMRRGDFCRAYMELYMRWVIESDVGFALERAGDLVDLNYNTKLERAPTAIYRKIVKMLKDAGV